MMSENRFPPYLLDKPPIERLAYFVNHKAKHPLLLMAYEELRCAIRDSIPGSIILVYGPTGVGKTTLLERVERHLKEEALHELEEDRDRFPVVRVQAVTPLTGNFDWKDYFRRLLIELEEPLTDSKIDMGRWESHHRNNMQLIASPKAVGSHLRHAAEQALGYREPIVLVDDAQHFAIIGSGRKLLDQLNIIKSVADVTRRTHVLCGTYELLPFRNLNGQLSRRSVDIHFQRYQAEMDEQRQAFINVLFTFQNHLPLLKTPDLVSDWDYFYERSIGCIGVLKDWITRAYALALEDNAKTLERSYLEQRALSISQCGKMLVEAIGGERKVMDSDKARLILRTSLGLKSEGEEALAIADAVIEEVAEQIPRKPRRSGRRGKRRPKRDEIGVNINGEEYNQSATNDPTGVISMLSGLEQ